MAFKKAKGQSHRGDEQKNGTESRQSFSADEPVREVEAATVVLEVVEELSEEELEDRQRLEIRVERSFFESGLALRELRDRRLYRDTHRKFEDYCRDRFDFTYRQANYLIAASNVVENLQTGTNCSHILPTKESQCRSLVTLEPDEQRQLWQEAVERSGGKVPTARVIKGIVERLKEKPVLQLSITYKRGDAFTLQGLTGAERRYNRCWAIAREILEFSLIVETHDGSLQVRPDNLEPIDDRAVRRQIAALLKRIQRLRKRELDRGAEVVLESLGKRTFLTEVEERLLKVLEDYYGIV